MARSPRRRRPTRSDVGRDRAQTAHDFALGMGVFLLTVAFVFATLPTLASPYHGGASDDRTQHAQRVAATALHQISADGERTRLDAERTAAFFRDNAAGDALRGNLGLPEHTSVNVSVRNGSRVVEATAADGTDVALEAGDPTVGRSTTRAVRVVSFTNGSACRPACRLVVDVW